MPEFPGEPVSRRASTGQPVAGARASVPPPRQPARCVGKSAAARNSFGRRSLRAEQASRSERPAGSGSSRASSLPSGRRPRRAITSRRSAKAVLGGRGSFHEPSGKRVRRTPSRKLAVSLASGAAQEQQLRRPVRRRRVPRTNSRFLSSWRPYSASVPRSSEKPE